MGQILALGAIRRLTWEAMNGSLHEKHPGLHMDKNVNHMNEKMETALILYNSKTRAEKIGCDNLPTGVSRENKEALHIAGR